MLALTLAVAIWLCSPTGRSCAQSSCPATCSAVLEASEAICVAVPLPNSGSVIFNPNGTIAVTVAGFSEPRLRQRKCGEMVRIAVPAEPPPTDIAPSLSTFTDELYS